MRETTRIEITLNDLMAKPKDELVTIIAHMSNKLDYLMERVHFIDGERVALYQLVDRLKIDVKVGLKAAGTQRKRKKRSRR